MRSLVIDGKVDASNMGDMLTQRLLGLLPVLLHRDPQELCVIGLGSGVTAGSALARGTVRRADVVEISPEVVQGVARSSSAKTGGVLDAPGVRLIVGDGRSHLLLTRRRYDVIVSEPSNPWMAGIAALFTREFFEAARARLQPDGLLCQWAHTYDMSQADLQSIVQTFASVFPQATMWLVGEGDLLLIGTNGASIEPNLEGLVDAVAARDDAARCSLTWRLPIAPRRSRCSRCSPAARPSCSGTAAARRFSATTGWRSSFPRRARSTGGRRPRTRRPSGN